MKKAVFVIIPNWNGADRLAASIDSVLAQTYTDWDLIIVDNGSVDGSRDIIARYEAQDSRIRSILRDKNYGFTGGVNPGLERAIKEGARYAAPFNNDAIADKNWLKHLVEALDAQPRIGIAACTLLHADGKTIDSTADQYTVWGIPYPRGRDEPADHQYDNDTAIFGASGGASMYRTSMLAEIGLFDQDFFAYYEDIDLSFRAQLAGWQVRYVPAAIVYHDQGKTSATMGKKGRSSRGANTFTTTQYMKNVPFIIVKDMPTGLLWRIVPRFLLAYSLFFTKALTDGRGMAAVKGAAGFWRRLPAKLRERRHIQTRRKVSDAYIWGLFLHDLPPNAHKLRKLRSIWWKLMRR